MRSVMSPRPMTLSDVNGLALDAGEAAQALHMTEEAFRAFYERTARPLWAYLARATGEPHTADDLLQDAYYRLLRSTVVVRRRRRTAAITCSASRPTWCATAIAARRAKWRCPTTRASGR